VWSPGDTAVAHSDACGIAVTRIADGQRRRLIEGNRAVGYETGCLHPTAWSPDGRELVITVGRGDTLAASHIWRYRFADSSLTPLVVGDDNSMHGTISPDGRWLAYVSDATGAHEVYVAPYGGGLRGQAPGGPRSRLFPDGIPHPLRSW
jgi:Tol biopolymer transport system component